MKIDYFFLKMIKRFIKAIMQRFPKQTNKILLTYILVFA